MNRFHNLPTEELLALEVQARKDTRELQKLIVQRFIAECGYEIGKSYRVIGGRFKGRILLITHITTGWRSPSEESPLHPVAHGRLDTRRHKRGWSLKFEAVSLPNLNPTPEESA